MCKRYNIDNSKRTKHTALIDCELLAKVYINLIDQKEPMLNFHQSANIKTKEKEKIKILYFKKIIKPTEEEFKLHKDYLSKNFKKNNFN